MYPILILLQNQVLMEAPVPHTNFVEKLPTVYNLQKQVALPPILIVLQTHMVD